MTYKTGLATAAAALCLGLPGAATAQSLEGLEIYTGFNIASEYVSQGLKQSEGFSFGGYVEATVNGFYAGGYTQTTDRNTTLYDWDSGVYFGYRGEVGRFSYDASIYYYMFDQPFAAFGPAFVVDDYEEYILSGTFAATDALYVTGTVGYAPEFEQTDVSVTADYYTNFDGLSISATYGAVDTNFGDWSYWSVGGSYAFSDWTSVDIAYHDSDATAAIGTSADGLFTATLNVNFSLR